MNLKEEDKLIGGGTQEILLEKNKEVLGKLEKYQEMKALVLEQRFGYLSLLTPQEISKFIKKTPYSNFNFRLSNSFSFFW